MVIRKVIKNNALKLNIVALILEKTMLQNRNSKRENEKNIV